MAPPNKQPPIRSPLLSAFNNIVNTKRSNYQIRSTKNSFDDFMRFMNVEVEGLKAQKLPDEKKISKLSTLNMASTFGRSGSLLSALASGAMDVAGFLGEFFRGKKKPTPKGGGVIPKSKGIRLGGLKALGVANAVFAGLDFATGLQEGESVGKAAAGAGGALAGSLLGGAIGTALIPFPPLGFMLGSAIGGMAGGYLGDRSHEAVTGEGAVKEKQKQKLAQLEAEQKESAASSISAITFPEVLDKFETVVYEFEHFMVGKHSVTSPGIMSDVDEEGEIPMEPPTPSFQNPNTMSGELGDYTVSGGQLPSSKRGSPFGSRWGRQHYGIDYPVNVGTPISIIQPGKVNYSGLDSGGNLVVYVDHDDGSHTRYLHLSKAHVQTGQKVEAGTLIGLTGGERGAYGSGNSTGPHLHYEYAPPGSGSVDPAAGNNDDKFFRFGGNITVKPKATAAGAAPGSGSPVVVLAAGTNDFQNNPKTAAAYIKRTIKDLQSKGYQVVYVPPSDQGAYAKVSAAMTVAATEQGATIEKAQYDPNDPTRAYTHISPGNEVDRIRNKYQGATFIGDSNAVRLAGGPDVAGTRVTGASVSDIEGFARNMKQVAPSQVQPQPRVEATPQQPVAPQQVSRYPEYNLPTSSPSIIVSMPIQASGGSKRSPMVSSTSGGGDESQVSSSPSKSQVLNSLFTTALLTNLSGT